MAGENNDLITGNGASGAGQLTGNFKLQSTSKGLTLSNMTTAQRDAIASPEKGLTIYNTTTNKLNVYTTTWEAITSA